MTISNDVYAAGQEILAAPSPSIADALNAVLNRFISDGFRAVRSTIADANGQRSSEFASVVRLGDAADPLQPVNGDSAAVAIDVCDELTIDALRKSYQRIAGAKRLTKTPTPKGEVRTNITLGIVFAPRATVPFEVIAGELERLNLQTPGQYRPDMICVGSTGVISYAVQFPGEGLSGAYLPPAEGALSNYVPAIYVVPVMTPTGGHSFNRMLAYILAHLWIYAPAIRDALPNYDDILVDVPTNGVTLGGYQYNLSGDLVPVPREHYNDRYLAPRPVLIEDNKGEVLATVQYLPWQDGAAVLLRGKLPLEGLLIFMGAAAMKKMGIVRRPNSQISHVLPITRADFDSWLIKFQRQSNMRVKSDTGRFVMQKLADEGASSPFMARIFLNVLRLREQVYTDQAKRDHFDKLYDYMSSALSNARASAQKIAPMWGDHAREIASGEAVEFVGRDVRINESIDKDLKSEVEAFLNSFARALKTGMQDIGKELGVNIGFLFQKTDSFEKGVEKLRKRDPDLAEYIRRTREWSEPFMIARNDLEHSTSVLPRISYTVVGNAVSANEPQVAGKPITEFVDFSFDRLCCFVEEFACHCLRFRMPNGITITEVPLANRPAEIPERFQITLTQGGLPEWRIAHHDSRFEAT